MYLPASGPKYAPVRFRLIALFVAAALLAVSIPQGFISLTPRAAAASPNIVISQVYGGGGNTGAQYTHDFVELFNKGTTSFTMTGWSIQYASATGTGNFGANTTQITEIPTVTLAAGQYLLIQEASGGTALAKSLALLSVSTQPPPSLKMAVVLLVPGACAPSKKLAPLVPVP